MWLYVKDYATRHIRRSSTLALQQRYKEAMERTYRSMARCNAGAGPFIQSILASVCWNFDGKCLFPNVDTMTFSSTSALGFASDVFKFNALTELGIKDVHSCYIYCTISVRTPSLFCKWTRITVHTFETKQINCS